MLDVIKEICAIVPGRSARRPGEPTTKKMLAEGRKLTSSKNVAVKVPEDGWHENLKRCCPRKARW